MKEIFVNVILKEDAKIPVYATVQSSGADVYCKEEFTLAPMQYKMIHTGVYMELPDGVECQVRSRSGLAAKKGVVVLNAPGTIDSDYRGECNVILMNLGEEEVHFDKDERIAQFVFCDNVVRAKFNPVLFFREDTERGEGGFGHTGMR